MKLLKIPDDLILPLLSGQTTITAAIGSMPLGALYVDPVTVGATQGEQYCLFFVLPMSGSNYRCVCPRAFARDGWFRLLIPQGWNHPFLCEKIIDENRSETPEQVIGRLIPKSLAIREKEQRLQRQKSW